MLKGIKWFFASLLPPVEDLSVCVRIDRVTWGAAYDKINKEIIVGNIPDGVLAYTFGMINFRTAMHMMLTIERGLDR